MEEGHSSHVVALSDKAGIPLVERQADLTPLQRHVILKQLEKQQEEIERRTNKGGGTTSRAPNPARKPRGGGRGQTTTYVNEKYE